MCLYVWNEGVKMIALCLELIVDQLEDDEISWKLPNCLRLQSWFHMFCICTILLLLIFSIALSVVMDVSN
jgi:hypothetical protein